MGLIDANCFRGINQVIDSGDLLAREVAIQL